MRILSKNSIINRLSLSPTLSKFNNTFLVVCIDDTQTINFFKKIVLFRHASLLGSFNFSDSYICFFDVSEFLFYLKICLEHFKINDEGVNLIFSCVYDGIFVNIFNNVLIEKLVFRYNFLLDCENYTIQLISTFILLIEFFVFSFVDLFLVNIEDLLFF